MKVFVAGASGAIGRPTVRQLVAAGHEVTGMTRREERAEEIRAAGAEAVVCDVYDAAALNEAVGAARPEAVVHLLTALPPRFRLRSNYLAATNRIRTEGTRNLIAAAREAGARRMVAESVAFFYRPEGDSVKDEEAPLFEEVGPPFREAVAAARDLECQVLEAEGIDGIVLRYGWLYGPGTYFARGGSQAQDTLKRRLPVVGPGTGISSFVHVDDAGAATVAAVEGGPPGVYNIVDDDPAPMRRWLPVYAEALGAKRPRKVPLWLARLVAGGAMADAAVAMRGATNEKAKRELGWRPAHPSWRQGFAESLA
ncbi:MAG TPA: SDR family NAD(P)-dependent oxidoreductase [Solirubrobacterales bacterium]|jgi:nucleoside-diphosphate-sugar epimerase|nr:SDR family NAD(P)-dependent oxidoreductase [Solirubrobacterales bacterium]